MTTQLPTGAVSWGDAVGELSQGAWTPPNGVVNFGDITAGVKTFQRDPAAPPRSWMDLNDIGPDLVISFSDISMLVACYQGKSYKFGCVSDPCGDNSEYWPDSRCP